MKGVFSGQGESPYRRYIGRKIGEPASGLALLIPNRPRGLLQH